MNKKSLEKKIEMVVRVFAIGIPVYIVLSLLLLNEYSYDAYFDPKKVYDVIKDALLIAAAFLAPIAAFVLFSDWRVEHQKKSTFQILDDLKNLSLSIKHGLGFYDAKIYKDQDIDTSEFKNREDRQIIQWQLVELKRMNSEFLIENTEIEDFQDLIIYFDGVAARALDQLHRAEFFYFNLISGKKHTDYEDHHLKSLKYFRNTFEELECISNKINLQVVKAKQSILQN